jgi:hypothetical protein
MNMACEHVTVIIPDRVMCEQKWRSGEGRIDACNSKLWRRIARSTIVISTNKHDVNIR